jgi:hypothetical protein
LTFLGVRRHPSHFLKRKMVEDPQQGDKAKADQQRHGKYPPASRRDQVASQ